MRLTYHTEINSKIVAFIVILLFALINFSAFGLTHVNTEEPLKGDSGHYSTYVENILERGLYALWGDSFDNYREPGYPFFLALTYKIFGMNNFWAVRIIQFLLLALTGYLIYLSFLTLGHAKAGLAIGSMTTLIPYFGYYSVKLTTEMLFTFLLALSFYVSITILKNKNTYTMNALLGFIIGYAAITRSQLQLFPLFIFGFLLFTLIKNNNWKYVSKRIVVGILSSAIIMVGWAGYSYSQSGTFSITEGRQGQILYIRATRAELSYQETGSYLFSWLKRSATGGESSDFLNRNEFKDLQKEYWSITVTDEQKKVIRDVNIETIKNNFGKYLAGNFVELVKLTFIEHTYSGSYNKYLRASFYVVLYLTFLFGLIRFIFYKQKEFRIIFNLSLVYLVYSWIIISMVDALPRYNTPLLFFYLLIGVSGIIPILMKCLNKKPEPPSKIVE